VKKGQRRVIHWRYYDANIVDSQGLLRTHCLNKTYLSTCHIIPLVEQRQNVQNHSISITVMNYAPFYHE